MDINAEKGLANGGTTPLGYRIENKHYVLDENTAPIVKEIFQKYAADWSIRKICDSLNERHIKTATGKTFNRSSLHTMLKNRKYLGIYIYNGHEIPGGMPQIIDEELFNKVQRKMLINKNAPARSRSMLLRRFWFLQIFIKSCLLKSESSTAILRYCSFLVSLDVEITPQFYWGKIKTLVNKTSLL